VRPDLGVHPIDCSVIGRTAHDATYGLCFEFLNRGTEAITFSTFEPFLAFSLLASVNGAPVAIDQPRLDIAVRPMVVQLPPGVPVALGTPIRLRFRAGAAPGRDGLVWTISAANEAVSLQIKLDLPAPLDIFCPVLLRA